MIYSLPPPQQLRSRCPMRPFGFLTSGNTFYQIFKVGEQRFAASHATFNHCIDPNNEYRNQVIDSVIK